VRRAVWFALMAALGGCVNLSPPAATPASGGPDACGVCDAGIRPDAGGPESSATPGTDGPSFDGAGPQLPSDGPALPSPDGPGPLQPRDAAVELPAMPVNQAPMVSGPTVATFYTTAGGALSMTATDDGLPVSPGSLTVSWTTQTGPGTVSFSQPAGLSTNASFSVPGSYVLHGTVSDGALSATLQVTVTVHGFDVALAGRWSFDTTAATAPDLSGGGNGARLIGGSTAVTPGRVGERALSIDQDGDYAEVSDPASGRLDFGTGDFTVAFWTKTTQKQGGAASYPMMMRKLELQAGDTQVGWEFFVWWSSGRYNLFKIWDGAANVSVAAKGLDDGSWHHVAGRRKGNEVAIFADGVLTETKAHGVRSLSSQAPLRMGSHAGEAWSDYDGGLDDVRVYGRALTDAEIGLLASGNVP
jgi:hypothetical protein